MDEAVREKWNDCQDKFDMAAVCYDEICKRLGGASQSVFLAEYFDRDKTGGNENPNLKRLRKLSNEIRKILYDEPDPEEQRKQVWTRLEQEWMLLRPHGTKEHNEASVFWAVLCGIDLDVADRKKRGHQFPEQRPLNRREEAECLVYLKVENQLLERFTKKYTFRKKTSEGGFRDSLAGLIFVDKSKLPSGCGYPSVISVGRHEGRKHIYEGLDREQTVRIALIPGRRPRQFSFDEKKTPGSTFCVVYPEGQEKEMELYCRRIRQAVKAGAHFVFFSEYSISPQMLEQIKTWLCDEHGKAWLKESSLLAVFAGTTWEEDAETEGHNNVMHVLNWRGTEVGTYNKYSPFTKMPTADAEDTYEMCEHLTNPGERICLFDMEGMGRIVPAVCRDVIDDVLPRRLVEQFNPFLMMVTAYSSSVAMFKRTLESYASEFYVSSVLCNSCDAVRRVSNGDLDLCVVPEKVKTAMRAHIKVIRQCRRLNEVCEDSCCILLKLDFSKAIAVDKRYPRISTRRVNG